MLMSTAAKLLRLDGREWVELLMAQAALLRAQWRLKRQPVGSLVRREGTESLVPAGDAARARSLALAVGRAAEHGVFRPRCLARALALRDLLVAHGITGSEIRVGVRRSDARFQAHAWVVWGDLVLGDSYEWVSRFTEVNDLRVLQDS